MRSTNTMRAITLATRRYPDVPAVNRAHSIQIYAELFRSESGRKAVAAQLRQLRKAK